MNRGCGGGKFKGSVMFDLEDKVVYPGHGVALISELIDKSVAGTTLKFFKLKFLYKDMTILVPMNNLENLGIRFLSEEKVIELAIKDLYNVPKKTLRFLDFTPSGWNKRNKEYQLKIQQGKLLDIIQIYKDLMYIAQQKDLSFGEKNLLLKVEELLVQEVQAITKKEREIIVNDLQAAFKQYFIQDADHVQNVSSSAA